MRTHRLRPIGVALLIGVVPLTIASCAQGSDSKAASSAVPAGGAANGQPAGAPSTRAARGVDLAVAKRPPSDRQVISTAHLDVQARDIDATVERATTVVVDAGGYVFSESASLTSAQHAHAVFKVPPARFADVIARVGRLGTLVHRDIGTQDVTGRVVDLGARLNAAQTSAERLRQLLADSGGVGDLLNVEGQLTTREGEVDSLAGQLGALRAQVDMATVTVDVGAVPKKTAAAAHEPPGFARGLRAGTAAFAGTARVTAAAVGIVLPFLPLVLVAALIWWLARRRAANAPAP